MRLYESPIPREEKSHSNRSLLHAEFVLPCNFSLFLSFSFNFIYVFSSHYLLLFSVTEFLFNLCSC